MAFQIKDFASIVASELNHARAVTKKVTDFQPGSVVRTIMEAPAVEIEEFYLQMFLGLREAIPVSTFLSFGFAQLPAAYATGVVTISSATPLTADIIIPLGAEFRATDGRAYLSTAALTWEQGETQITVPVRHATVGLVGNIAAGAITSSTMFGAGFVVSNLPITTGRDLESFAEREARFADYIASLSRGTIAACTYAAKLSSVQDASGNTVEYVTRAGLVEDAGWVRIYVYSNLGPPSDELVEDGQRRIDGWRDDEVGLIVPGFRSAGVRVDILPMVERSVQLSVSVDMLDGYTLTPAVLQELRDLASAAIIGLQPGETLYLGTLVERMLVATGVHRIVPATNSNIVCAQNEALVPGVITITELA